MTTLGETLRAARQPRKVSLRAVASIFGITPSYLCDIENDRRIPAEDLLVSLGRYFNLDCGMLMSLAGRVGREAEGYAKRHPLVWSLVRKIAERDLRDDELEAMIDVLD